MAADNESRITSPSRAELRATEGLSASLSRDRAEVLRWKDENPLRLVAATLVDMRRPAKRGDIREKLSPEIISPNEWDRWWNRIQPAMKESRHFSQDARHEIRLRAKPSEIEPVSLRVIAPSSRKTRGGKSEEWIEWLVSDGDIPMPKSPLRMSEDLEKRLREQEASLVPTTISKLYVEIEKRAFGANESRKASSGAWVKVFSAALARWSKPPTIPNVSTTEIVSLTARLNGVSKIERGDWESLTESLANYTAANVGNADEIANAIIASSLTAPRETTALLEQINGLLGELARKDLWWRLIIADSATSESGRISDWLNNRWRNIPDDEKTEIETSLIMASQDSDLIGNLNLLIGGEWDFAGSERRQRLFNPILFGWFMRDALMLECRRILRELSEQIGKNGVSATDSLMSEFEKFIAIAARDRLKRQGDDYENKLAVADGRLRGTEAELERAGKRERYLQSELRDAAFVKGLRFNRDAIIILGQSLHGLATSQIASHQDVENVKDKITFALSKLGAKPFGEVGKVVPFEPGVHETHPAPVAGVPVRITGPGVEYFKDVDTPEMMIKIQVQVEDPA